MLSQNEDTIKSLLIQYERYSFANRSNLLIKSIGKVWAPNHIYFLIFLIFF